MSVKSFEALIPERRYEVASKITQKVVKKRETKPSISDALDQVFLHKWLGLPIFFAMLWAAFRWTFDASAPVSDAIDAFFSWLGEIAATVPNEVLASFLSDGLCGGLGFVLVFVGPIFFLFFALGLLEDSGYLARAAFLMDRLMHRFGMHGRSFICMLMGFGCNLPAIMSTRTIADEKDRLTTILVNPLMSCSARLPVYVVVAGAVMGQYASAAVFSMYVLGLALALMMALLFRRVLFGGEPSPFIMELPPYSKPLMRNVFIYMWERGVVFLKKAATILLAGALILWFLSTFPWGAGVENSYAGLLGHAIEPLLRPLGFDWRLAVALFFGFMAKEVVVEALGILYGVEGEEAVSAILANSITPLTGYAFMAFTLIYIPCLATIGIIKSETGSWKWTLFSIVYLLALAYIVSALIVALGHLLGFG